MLGLTRSGVHISALLTNKPRTWDTDLSYLPLTHTVLFSISVVPCLCILKSTVCFTSFHSQHLFRPTLILWGSPLPPSPFLLLLNSSFWVKLPFFLKDILLSVFYWESFLLFVWKCLWSSHLHNRLAKGQVLFLFLLLPWNPVLLSLVPLHLRRLSVAGRMVVPLCASSSSFLIAMSDGGSFVGRSFLINLYCFGVSLCPVLVRTYFIFNFCSKLTVIPESENSFLQLILENYKPYIIYIWLSSILPSNGNKLYLLIPMSLKSLSYFLSLSFCPAFQGISSDLSSNIQCFSSAVSNL